MSLLNGKCPHGWPVVRVRVGMFYGHHDPHIWTVEHRPVESCRLCAEQDDGRPLDVYVQHPLPGEEPVESVAMAAGRVA